MPKLKIGVLVSGNGSNLQAIIDATESERLDTEVSVVISNKKNAYALTRASKHGICGVYIGKENYFETSKRNAAIIKTLEDHKVDMVVLAGYLDILDKEIIEKYRKRIINIHPSLIPKYCGKGFYGMHVHEAAINNKETISGATVHFVDEGIDTGEIILQRQVDVSKDDTPDTLQQKVLQIEHSILIEAINQIKSCLKPVY